MAFTAYVRIVECIDAIQRADLYTVAIHLFSDLLADETPTMDYAGSTLPVLKMLLDAVLGPGAQVPGMGSATGERVVHGLLSSCLSHVDDMRTRVNPVANTKIKNNLLALTLVLTSLPASLPISKVVVEQICYTVSQYLDAARDRPELGLTAIHCSTSLLQASLRPMPSSFAGAAPAPSPILQHAALHLIPYLVTFISESIVTSATSTSAQLNEGVKEVVKALVSWTAGLPDSVKPRGYAVLLPTLCLLLDPTGTDPPTGLHVIAATTLLGLAQTSPISFRDVTQAMEVDERGRLEKAVRDRVGGAQGKMGQMPLEKKGIELRSFG